MATATKKVNPARSVGGGSRGASKSTLKFLVQQDNGGAYHWEIVGERGEPLARSVSFVSYDEAERGALRVHDDAGSAPVKPHAAQKHQLATV